MTRRGKRSWQKKKKTPAAYPGGLQIPPRDTASSSRAPPPSKDAIEDDSSDSAPEELPSLTSNLKNPDWSKVKDLPNCPTPSRMFSWSPMDYQLYDEFLIAKFNVLGFSEREKTYVNMRDRNSRVARVARAICRRRGQQW